MQGDPEAWEVDQDEFGRPLVRHRHVTESKPAYVTKDAYAARNAWCPICKAELLLNGTPDPQ